MDIIVGIEWSREISSDVKRQLKEFNALRPGPDAFFIWKAKKLDNEWAGSWKGRWEIWGELGDVSHPDAANRLLKDDRYFTERGCWGRKVQSWAQRDAQFMDCGYADLRDDNVFLSLEVADAWKDRRFFDVHIDDVEHATEARKKRERASMIRDGSNYYYNFDRTLVAPGGKSPTADWRHRIR